MAGPFRLPSLVVLSLLLHAGAAGAKDAPVGPSSALHAAETAFQSVDFATALALAQRGLDLGGASPAQTARLHVLAGTSAAALGHDVEARKHFLAALAIHPTLKLEQDLSPKLRDPYLEALGYWGSRSDRLTLRVKIDTQVGRAAFSVVDPAQLGTSVQLHLRVRGSNDFSTRVVNASQRGHIDLPRSALNHGFDYFVTLLDEQGNRLVEVGTEDDSIPVEPQRRSAVQVTSTQAFQSESMQHRRQSVWPQIALIGTGLVATGLGVYFNVRREGLASEWNGKTCELPGMTRIQQCSDINADRTTMERLAIGSYAVGGALLATGVTLLLLGSDSTNERHPSRHAVSCGVSTSAPFVTCLGRF